jgi:peptidoglycan/xylan/chitin deacetylase (PgdA/CDA1 family)
MKTEKSLSNNASALKGGRFVTNSVSLASQMGHLMAFELRKPRMKYDAGMLIISIDVDVGCKKLGLINEGRNDANVHKLLSEARVGDIEEHALPRFINTFSNFEVPATFALRGQLSELEEPFMDLFLNSSVKHDIGAHGYYHKNFKFFTRAEAEKELTLTAIGLKKLGVTPKSFIFPRNAIRHLDALEKFGYACYRENGNLRSDGMFIEKKGDLYNIQPSLYLCPSISPLILKKILDLAVTKKAPLHLWFHTWNFGTTDKKIEGYVKNIFSPFLKYANNKKKNGLLTFETMLSASKKAEALFAEKESKVGDS